MKVILGRVKRMFGWFDERNCNLRKVSASLLRLAEVSGLVWGDLSEISEQSLSKFMKSNQLWSSTESAWAWPRQTKPPPCN